MVNTAVANKASEHDSRCAETDAYARLRLCFTCYQPGHIAANCSHGYRPPQSVQTVQYRYIPVAPSAAPQLMHSQPAAVTGNPQAVLGVVHKGRPPLTSRIPCYADNFRAGVQKLPHSRVLVTPYWPCRRQRYPLAGSLVGLRKTKCGLPDERRADVSAVEANEIVTPLKIIGSPVIDLLIDDLMVTCTLDTGAVISIVRLSLFKGPRPYPSKLRL